MPPPSIAGQFIRHIRAPLVIQGRNPVQAQRKAREIVQTRIRGLNADLIGRPEILPDGVNEPVQLLELKCVKEGEIGPTDTDWSFEATLLCIDQPPKEGIA